jgi:hypothetical protein
LIPPYEERTGGETRANEQDTPEGQRVTTEGRGVELTDLPGVVARANDPIEGVLWEARGHAHR